MSTAIEVKEISDLVMKSQDFSELSDRLDVYCPFEALSVARLEIRHSNFLAVTVVHCCFYEHVPRQITFHRRRSTE